jgi:hypothetical protein
MAATNEQVQQFVNEVIRPICEDIRNLRAKMSDARARIDDVYANLSSSPTWTDTRPDAPAHLMTPSDVLGVNAFMADTLAAIDAHGQYPVVVDACVRPLI